MDAFNSIVINRIQGYTQSPIAKVSTAFVSTMDDGSGAKLNLQGTFNLTAMPSIVVAYGNAAGDAGKWKARFDEIKLLRKGWNGYTAPVPSDLALKIARSFTDLLLGQNYPPSKLSATVVGGVATTVFRGDKQVFVEFYNNGSVLALFSDDSKDEEPRIDEVKPEYGSFKALIERMRSFLDG